MSQYFPEELPPSEPTPESDPNITEYLLWQGNKPITLNSDRFPAKYFYPQLQDVPYNDASMPAPVIMKVEADVTEFTGIPQLVLLDAEDAHPQIHIRLLNQKKKNVLNPWSPTITNTVYVEPYGIRGVGETMRVLMLMQQFPELSNYYQAFQFYAAVDLNPDPREEIYRRSLVKQIGEKNVEHLKMISLPESLVSAMIYRKARQMEIGPRAYMQQTYNNDITYELYAGTISYSDALAEVFGLPDYQTYQSQVEILDQYADLFDLVIHQNRMPRYCLYTYGITDFILKLQNSDLIDRFSQVAIFAGAMFQAELITAGINFTALGEVPDDVIVSDLQKQVGSILWQLASFYEDRTQLIQEFKELMIADQPELEELIVDVFAKFKK